MLTATIFLMSLGLVAAIILVVASRVFYVWEDPRIEQVSEALLGANCGGCGYAGCAAAAEAVVQKKAKPDVCVAGGFEIAKAVAEVMGMTVEEKEPEFSKPGCTYGYQDADLKYEYDGFSDCRAAMMLYDGSKICDIGCIGLGTCVRACPFDALLIGDNNLPVVDNDKCTGCGVCEEICPKGIITLSSATIRLMSDQKISECTAPCQRHCPAEIDIPTYIQQIKKKDYEGALRTIREKNPFPLICGWICPSPCELECRRNLIDEPVSINGLKKFVAEYERKTGKYILPYLPPDSGKKISVIGGGIEGLTASYFLRRLGYQVTIFESTEILGGILRYVISEEKLPGKALDWEIEGILSTGIEHKTGTVMGRDISMKSIIQSGEEMVLVTAGGWDSRQIMNSSGNMDSIIPETVLLMDFLNKNENKSLTVKGKKVVIAGEGNSSLAAADMCIAEGASKVCLIFPFSREEAVKRNLNISIRDKLEIVFSSVVSGLTGIGDKLDKVSFRNEFGDVTEIDLDKLILDSGRLPEMLFELDQETNRWKTIEILKVFGNGNSGGIFALKNIGRPTDLERVVVAVGIGRKLARGLYQYSRGEEIKPEDRIITNENELQNIFRIPQREKLIDHRGNYDPEGIFTEDMVKDQAERCLSCGLICYQHSIDLCKLVDQDSLI
ncbi:MAG: FAD-dependent oxidoreductase [Acidobacteriota bacterium]